MAVPGVAQILLQVFLNLIYVDLLMTDQWLPQLFLTKNEVADNDAALSPIFDENGFSSQILVKNLGSSFLYLLIYLGLVQTYLIVRFFSIKLKKMQSFAAKLQNFLFWNGSIAFLSSQFPPIFLAAFLNIRNLKFATNLDRVSYIFCVLSAVFLPIALISEFIIIKRHSKDIESEEFKKKYGKLVEGLNTSHWVGLYWNPIILTRWAAVNTILVLLKEAYQIQIFSFLVISLLFQAMIVLGKPMEGKFNNFQTLIIEIAVSVYLYVMLILTDYTGQSNIGIRENCGWTLAMLVVGTVSINVLIFLGNLLLKLPSLYTKWQRKKSFKRAKKEPQQAPAPIVVIAPLSPIEELKVEEFSLTQQQNQAQHQSEMTTVNYERTMNNARDFRHVQFFNIFEIPQDKKGVDGVNIDDSKTKGKISQKNTKRKRRHLAFLEAQIQQEDV